MTFFKENWFSILAFSTSIMLLGYVTGMSIDINDDKNQTTNEFRDVGYAIDYDSYYYNSVNFTKKYVQYDAYVDDAVVTTVRHGDETHVFIQKFFSNHTGILEQIPIGSSRCGTGDWLCLYEPPTTVFLELSVDSSTYLDYSKMGLNNDRIVSVDWLDIDGDGVFSWVFGFDMEDTWKNPDDVVIPPWMVFTVYMIDEPEYNTVYYKKISLVEIESMMKSCVKKDGLWINDKCVFLSELEDGDYIRLEILENSTRYDNDKKETDDER